MKMDQLYKVEIVIVVDEDIVECRSTSTDVIKTTISRELDNLNVYYNIKVEEVGLI